MTVTHKRLSTENCCLVIIDIQGNLAQTMVDKDMMFDNVKKLIEGMKVFNIPLVVTEQIPEKLGSTLPEINDHLRDVEKISKSCFSCCKNKLFMNKLSALERGQVILTGIETHICVYQTSIDLLQAGYEVHCVADAVSSRTKQNRKIGIRKICSAGAALTSTETVLFELLQTADDKRFKKIFNIVK